jgi:hypothetical protein
LPTFDTQPQSSFFFFLARHLPKAGRKEGRKEGKKEERRILSVVCQTISRRRRRVRMT